MRTIILFFFVSIFFINQAQTIINTEKLLINDSTKHTTIIEPNIDFQNGNTNVLDFTNSFNHFWRINSKNTLKIIFGNNILLENNSIIINDNFIQLRYLRNFKKKYSNFYFLQYQNSNNLLLYFRQLYGTGIRYKLIDKNKIKIDIASGIFNEQERLFMDQISNPHLYVNTPSTNVYRMANFSVLQLNVVKDLKILNTTYFQPIINNLTDYRVLNDMDIIYKAKDWLDFNLNIIYRYDNMPPEVLKNYDLLVTGGLLITLKK